MVDPPADSWRLTMREVLEDNVRRWRSRPSPCLFVAESGSIVQAWPLDLYGRCDKYEHDQGEKYATVEIHAAKETASIMHAPGPRA